MRLRSWIVMMIGLSTCAATFHVGLLSLDDASWAAPLATVGAFGGMAILALGQATRARQASAHEAEPDASSEVHPEMARSVDTIIAAHAKIVGFERGELFSDVFVGHFSQFALEIEAAAVRQTLEVAPTAHMTRSLLACMTGEDDDICRFVHHFDNNDFFFGRHSRDYFERSTDALADGRIRTIRRLFVDSGSGLEDERSRRLIGFHKNVRGYDCRVMGTADFHAVAVDNGFPEEHLDFGVYGDKYVYVSNQRPLTTGASPPVGIFVAAAVEIKRYTDLFDDLWSKGTDQPEGFVIDPCASVQELFG